jgi:hydrogenase small subunit
MSQVELRFAGRRRLPCFGLKELQCEVNMVIPKRLSTPYRQSCARGVDRRTFLSLCAKTTALMGLSASMIPQVVKAFVTQPRIPVVWLHGLECTGCSESFLRSYNPTVQDVILNLISLDYHMTLQAAAGTQAENIRQQVMRDFPGQYLLAVEGSIPAKAGGVYCTVGGDSFLNILQETAAYAKAVIAWGSCASHGGIAAASPNPTGAKPVSALVNKTVVNIPGCPPIAEVMTGIVAHLLMDGRLPDLDNGLRPLLYYGNTVHASCPRKPYFDAGQFLRQWDDTAARSGWCLYRMGCRGPETYNACSEIMWNNGVSLCTHAGHPCIGCSERNFWDVPLYPGASRPTNDREHNDTEIGD